MSGSEFDNFSEGDWENHEELAWNEFDWQQYLKKNETEIAKFLSYFHKLKTKNNHLDEIARHMGWDQEDWRAGELNDDDGPEGEADAGKSELSPDPLGSKLDPYTVHKHPVYIVTHGLYQNLFQSWEQFILEYQWALSPFFVSQFSASLHVGEFNAIMAINALDMADYNLTVCHLKNALTAINHTLGLAKRIPPKNPKLLQAFNTELTTSIFDLREIWLRVMADCREEHRRRRGDNDQS